MPQGLQVWNEASQVILDTDMRLAKVLGSFIVSYPNNGSINVPEFAGGIPIFVKMDLNNQNTGVAYLTVTVSGTTLSWQWNEFFSAAGMQTRIVYGYY